MQVLINIATVLLMLAIIVMIVGWNIDRYVRWANGSEGPGFLIFVIGLIALVIDLGLWMVFGFSCWIRALL